MTIGPGAPYYAYGYTNYTVGHIMTFSTVGITTRMQFNNTFFWTSATPTATKVNVTLNYLHVNPGINDTVGTLLMNFTVKAGTAGVTTAPVTIKIGGLTTGYQYAVYKDSIIDVIDVGDVSGNISYTNSSGAWDGFAHNFTVYVWGAVPVVTTNPATGVTATNATLNGFLDDGGALPLGCTVRFEYGLTIGYGTNTTNQTKATGASFKQNVVLAPSTYHFRAIADDGIATSYGIDRLFTIIGSPTVTTNGTTGVGTTNATLWGYLSSNGGSSSCNLSFQYGFSVAYGNTTSVTVTAASTLIYSKDIIGLTSGHLYHYRAKAYNGIATTYGADQSFTTVSIGGGIIKNPRQIKANWTTSSSLNITFTKGINSTTTKIYRKVGSYPGGVGDGTLICNTTLTYYNDTGISPSTRYFYRAYGWHGIDGYSAGTNIAMVETDNTTVTTSSSASFKGYMTTDKNIWTHFHYSTVPTFATTIVNITMKTERYEETPTSYETLNVDYKRVQSFTVGNTSLDVRNYLYNVSLKAYRVGGLTTIVAQLYAAAGNFSGSGIPTGPVLAYGSKDVSTLTTSTSGEWVNITMSPYYLHTITRYCIVFTTAAGGGNQFNMLKDTAPDYTGGSIFESYAGGSYSNHTGDFIFSLYGHRPYTYTSATMTSNTTIPTTTAFSIPQSDLISGQIYYYYAEGNDTNGNMTKGNTRHTLTNPDIPIYLNIIPYFSNSSVKISWLTGNGANQTVVAYSNTAYPSVVPGATVSYNGTGLFCWVHNISFNTTCFFSLFSFTTWAGLSRFSSGVHIPWGGVSFNCYNESSGLPIGYNVLISNSGGDETYYGPDLWGYTFINVTTIPMGDDIGFYISNSSGLYNSRIYYYDIIPNIFYNFSFYLPVTLIPPSTNDSYYYGIKVVDMNGAEIPNVLVTVKTYILTTGVFEIVASGYTAADGIYAVWLRGSSLYKIFLNKTGYKDNVNNFPTPSGGITITYVLEFEDIYIQPARNPGFYVFFEDLSSRTNSTLYLHYHDTLDGTINVHVYVYEHNVTTGNITVFYSNEGITLSEFYLNLTGLRANNSYSVNLFYNHTEFGSQSLTAYFEGWHTTLITPYQLNIVLTAIFKSGAMVLSHFMMFLLLLAMFYWVDKEHVGIGLIIIGGLFLCINIYIGIDDALTTAASGVIPTLLMVVGGMKEAITRGLIG